MVMWVVDTVLKTATIYPNMNIQMPLKILMWILKRVMLVVGMVPWKKTDLQNSGLESLMNDNDRNDTDTNETSERRYEWWNWWTKYPQYQPI